MKSPTLRHTPTLKGKNAEAFWKEMNRKKTPKEIAKKKKFLKECLDIYNKTNKWTKVKMSEIQMLRKAIDKKWVERMKSKIVAGQSTDFIFSQIWDDYSYDRYYITNVGYLPKIKVISRAYIGKLIKKYKRKELEKE